MHLIEEDIESVLINERELDRICAEIGKKITEDYRDSERDLVFVIVLKGSLCFGAKLVENIPLACDLEFMKLSSYGAGTVSSGFIQVHLDLKRDIKDADVIVIEDIVDSGRTLAKLTHLLSDRGAHSVRCCTLLDKPSRRQVEFRADYVGKVIPDVFVVGFGLDYDEKYRNLPYVGILKPAVYQK